MAGLADNRMRGVLICREYVVEDIENEGATNAGYLDVSWPIPLVLALIEHDAHAGFAHTHTRGNPFLLFFEVKMFFARCAALAWNFYAHLFKHTLFPLTLNPHQVNRGGLEGITLTNAPGQENGELADTSV